MDIFRFFRQILIVVEIRVQCNFVRCVKVSAIARQATMHHETGSENELSFGWKRCSVRFRGSMYLHNSEHIFMTWHTNAKLSGKIYKIDFIFTRSWYKSFWFVRTIFFWCILISSSCLSWRLVNTMYVYCRHNTKLLLYSVVVADDEIIELELAISPTKLNTTYKQKQKLAKWNQWTKLVSLLTYTHIHGIRLIGLPACCRCATSCPVKSFAMYQMRWWKFAKFHMHL